MNNIHYLLMFSIMNRQFASAERIDRLSSFSKFHTTANNKGDESFDRLDRFKLVKNPKGSRTDERIGKLLAQMANYKRFKTTNEKEELWWIYSNILM